MRFIKQIARAWRDYHNHIEQHCRSIAEQRAREYSDFLKWKGIVK